MTPWPTVVPPALVVLVLALAGCTADEPRRGGAPDGYSAVPDDELLAAIVALPAVRSADVDYVDELGRANTYDATVKLRRGVPRAGARRTFDQVVTVLRHGRWQASTSVEVLSDDVVVTGAGLDLVSSSDYEEAYGPQTGRQGWPPPFVSDP